MKTFEADPFFNTENCVNRLLEVYRENPRLIIAVDFDDTMYDFHKKGYLFPHVADILRESQKLNFYIVAFTASIPSRFEFIRTYCQDIGIRLDAINENVIESPFGNSGKIFYNLLLDDRAGLGQAYEILQKTIELVKKNELERLENEIKVLEVAYQFDPNAWNKILVLKELIASIK